MLSFQAGRPLRSLERPRERALPVIRHTFVGSSILVVIVLIDGGIGRASPETTINHQEILLARTLFTGPSLKGGSVLYSDVERM